MTPIPLFSENQETFFGFKARAKISIIFLEHERHVLLLKRSSQEEGSNLWGIPGGKSEEDETPLHTVLRELKEETGLQLTQSQVFQHGHRYARLSNWDYIVYLFYAQLKERPIIQLNSKEHVGYEWVSLYAFKSMPLLSGQEELFDIVYASKIWQPIVLKNEAGSLSQSALVLRKGDQTIHFGGKRRFILNMIGTSGSGKGTQGEMLSKRFGIPTLSAGDLFRKECRKESKLGWMIKQHDAYHFSTYLPDEVPIGMLAKRLAKEDCSDGFILDGFPRTEKQGDVICNVFLRPKDFHVPLFMDVSERDIKKRLLERLICSYCGHQVRAFDLNPWPGYCPIDAAKNVMIKLEPRVEDSDEKKLERRLKIFRENKAGILSSMGRRDPIGIFSLDNEISPKAVFHRLCDHIEDRLDALAHKELRKDPSFLSQMNLVQQKASAVLPCLFAFFLLPALLDVFGWV